MSSCQQCRKLRGIIRELEEELLQAREVLTPPDLADFLKWEFRITAKQSLVLATLVSHTTANREKLLTALYSSGDRPESDTLATFMHYCRASLKKHSIQIHSLQGYGYWLSSNDRARLKRLYAISKETTE